MDSTSASPQINFLVVVHGRMQDLPRGAQLFEGLGELHAAAKRLLGGSVACFTKNFFLNGAFWSIFS